MWCALSALTLLFALFCFSGALAQEWVVGENQSLTEAVERAQAGDVIRLAAGVYAQPEESYPIAVDKSIAIIGVEGTILEGPPFVALLEITAPDVVIENVAFHLRRFGVLGLADGLVLRDCSFVLADDTYRVSSCGVWLAGAYRATIEGCSFAGCGLCVAGPPISERSKDVPVLTGLFEVGEDLELFTSHTIQNNLINGKPLYYIVGGRDATVPSDAGGLIAVGCDGITIEGLDVSDSSMGIQVVHSQNVRVRNTVADRCGIFGVYLACVEQGLVEGVRCREANHGIDIRGARNVAVVDCLAEDCEQGVFFTWSEECMADRCRILRCGAGVFASTGSNNQITRCVIEQNGNGIYLQNEDNTLVYDNVIAGNTVAGLRMLKSGGQCVNNEIFENRAGVIVATAEHATLWGNTFRDNLSAGLYVRDLSGGKIAGNEFSGEPGVFLELEGELTDTLIRDNTFGDKP